MFELPSYVTGAGLTVLALVSLAVYLWMVRPGLVLDIFTRLALYKLGLKQHKVKAGKYTYNYAERGRQRSGSPSLLLVHGFSANKDMYLPVVEKLPRDLHVVLVDLIGHGHSDLPDDDLDMSLLGLSKTVKQFVDAIGLSRQPFHLLGTSLGGAISAVYSATYPRDVERLTLCCPAMLTPTTTPFQEEVKVGKCRLLPTDISGIKEMMVMCLYHHKKIPMTKQALKGLLQQRQPRQHFFASLFDVIRDKMFHEQELFLDQVTRISAPTQVIWGNQDEVLHVSGTELLKSKLKNCQRVDTLDRCGHVISMDRPYHMTKVVMEFRGETSKEKGL